MVPHTAVVNRSSEVIHVNAPTTTYVVSRHRTSEGTVVYLRLATGGLQVQLIRRAQGTSHVVAEGGTTLPAVPSLRRTVA